MRSWDYSPFCQCKHSHHEGGRSPVLWKSGFIDKQDLLSLLLTIKILLSLLQNLKHEVMWQMKPIRLFWMQKREPGASTPDVRFFWLKRAIFLATRDRIGLLERSRDRMHSHELSQLSLERKKKTKQVFDMFFGAIPNFPKVSSFHNYNIDYKSPDRDSLGWPPFLMHDCQNHLHSFVL